MDLKSSEVQAGVVAHTIHTGRVPGTATTILVNPRIGKADASGQGFQMGLDAEFAVHDAEDGVIIKIDGSRWPEAERSVLLPFEILPVSVFVPFEIIALAMAAGITGQVHRGLLPPAAFIPDQMASDRPLSVSSVISRFQHLAVAAIGKLDKNSRLMCPAISVTLGLRSVPAVDGQVHTDAQRGVAVGRALHPLAGCRDQEQG